MADFRSLRIVFFGTPDFAVVSLKALVEAGCKVVAVVTAPDKPAGRGMQLQQSAVKQYALSQGLPVLQPLKLKDPGFIGDLRQLQADLHIVVAFRMLPEAVWNMPPMGTVNVHASLLPQYRGAAPINWAVINGEEKTGVTTFRLKHEIDTGNVLLQREVPILPDMDAGTLYGILMEAGAELLVATVQGLAEDSIREQAQASFEAVELKHAPKIFREHLEIGWDRPVQAVYNLIRGLAPHPAAFTTIAGKNAKIYKAHVLQEPTGVAAGTIDTDHKTYLRFAAADGWLYIDELQLEGKKRMETEAFLRGFRL